MSFPFSTSMPTTRPIAALTTLSAVLTSIAVTACTTPDEPFGDDAVTIDGEPQVLVMATSADYPPYEFYKTVAGDGEPVGFDVDIAKHITGELGYDLEIQDMAFNSIIPALQSQRVDFAMAGMTPTAERKESVDFTGVYYDAQSIIVAATGAGYRSYADLVGTTVGVQLGSIQEGELEDQAKTVDGITIEPRNKISELVQSVEAGQIDAAIIEGTVAKHYMANTDGLELNPVARTEESGSAIAFPKGSELRVEFEQVLDQMKENGTLDKLVNRWFEAYYEQQEDE